MVNGKPYDFPVEIGGIDSYGDTYEESRWITVMTSLPGKSYNPVELNWFDAGLKALSLFLFVIIVLAILMFVYNMFKGEPYDEDEDDFDFEDDEEPFEPASETAEAPEAPEQELVEP
jgi:cbb3-type cytochrome oxidase subunit 3